MQENPNIGEERTEQKTETVKKPYPGLHISKIELTPEEIMKAELPGGKPSDCVLTEIMKKWNEGTTNQ